MTDKDYYIKALEHQNDTFKTKADTLLEVLQTVVEKTKVAEGDNMEAAFDLLDWLKIEGLPLMRNTIEKAHLKQLL